MCSKPYMATKKPPLIGENEEAALAGAEGFEPSTKVRGLLCTKDLRGICRQRVGNREKVPKGLCCWLGGLGVGWGEEFFHVFDGLEGFGVADVGVGFRHALGVTQDLGGCGLCKGRVEVEGCGGCVSAGVGCEAAAVGLFKNLVVVFAEGCVGHFGEDGFAGAVGKKAFDNGEHEGWENDVGLFAALGFDACFFDAAVFEIDLVFSQFIEFTRHHGGGHHEEDEASEGVAAFPLPPDALRFFWGKGVLFLDFLFREFDEIGQFLGCNAVCCGQFKEALEKRFHVVGRVEGWAGIGDDAAKVCDGQVAH